MPGALSDFVLSPAAAGGAGIWIQLVNNATGQTFVSPAASAPTGLFSFGAVPAGQYTLNIGASPSGPWTLLNPNYVVADVLGWYSVKDYGAKGDGATDDSTAIQNCINTANSNGGGVVYFPAGTYIAFGLNCFGKIHYLGAGYENTILKLKNASNTFLLQTNNFATLAAGGGGSGAGTSTGGESQFTFEQMTLDGNSANNGSSTVPVLRIYGFGFQVGPGLRMRSGKVDNLYTEWSTSLPSPGADSMMAFCFGVKSHDAGANGIHWNGPHDSMVFGGEIFNNNVSGVAGNAAAGANVFVDTKGSGTLVNGVHSWGLAPTWAYLMNGSGVMLNNAIAEGAATAQIGVDANDCSVVGGFIYGAGASTPKGIVLGVTASRVGTYIKSKINNCTSGAVDFTNDGISTVDVHVFQSGGTLFVGTPNVASRVDFLSNGVAGGFNQFPGDVHIKSGSGLRLYNGTNVSFATLSFDGSQVNNTWPYQGAAGQFVASGAGIRPGTPAAAVQGGNIFMAGAAPSNSNGNNGDVCFRTDTTAAPHLMKRITGTWTTIV